MDSSLPGEIRSDLSLPYSVIPPLFTIKYVTLTPQGKDEEKKTRNATSEGFPPPQRECQGQGRHTRVPQHMLLAACLGQTLECDWWLLMVSPYTPSARKEFPKRFRGNSLRHWVIPLRSRHRVTSEENSLSLSLSLILISVLALSPSRFAFEIFLFHVFGSMLKWNFMLQEESWWIMESIIDKELACFSTLLFSASTE